MMSGPVIGMECVNRFGVCSGAYVVIRDVRWRTVEASTARPREWIMKSRVRGIGHVSNRI
jgi:hypothetical protein